MLGCHGRKCSPQ